MAAGSLPPEHDRNETANAWTRQGIELLDKNTPATLRESITCFDRAIQLRQSLPLAQNPWWRYGLIAGWMNRGDALTRLGSPGELDQAIAAYEQAFVHLELLEMDVDPAFPRRLAIASLNFGQTLLRRAGAGDAQEASGAFERAITVLTHATFHSSDRETLLGAAWVNSASAWLQHRPPLNQEALVGAERGRQLVAAWERTDFVAAEISLKGHHAFCRAAAALLSANPSPTSIDHELLGRATDAVEAALLLASHWEMRSVTSFRPLASEIFHFGALCYARFQPRFVAEFLLEHSSAAASPASAPARTAVIRQALCHAIQTLSHDFRTVGTPQFEETLTLLSELCQAENQWISNSNPSTGCIAT